MSQISTKINLAALPGVSVRKFKSAGSQIADTDCLVIPIAYNHLFQGEKGVYIDLTGFVIKNKTGDSKDTHLVKQSFSKEIFDKMTDEEKKATPILGGHIVWPDRVLGESNTPLPVHNEEDDLPF
ncbi:hypothetical protein [Pedobacter duraquae]|uniref:Uncharacterized protein n=1 Tax=Pedobacter duraquae TaxID=425511 RepID=A0A4R6IIX7_9SPHI|nr:hypothetical protein [Pedobacter duraquae]TDO21927.1 hypothetical protein CLV32_3035 [Pedobacter duraquae]